MVDDSQHCSATGLRRVRLSRLLHLDRLVELGVLVGQNPTLFTTQSRFYLAGFLLVAHPFALHETNQGLVRSEPIYYFAVIKIFLSAGRYPLAELPGPVGA